MKQLSTLFLLSASIFVYGQGLKIIEFTEDLKKYDVSDLLTSDSFETDYDTIDVKKMEPIGYIGESFQRLYIHFISAIQNPNNKLEYFIYGKSKVKENICTFQGTITITESKLYEEKENPNFKQGIAKGQYEFFEDPDQKGTGIFKGNFQTDFFINEDGELKYDALFFGADGYQNNQFEGTWSSYSSEKSKQCNWGDYRIPESDDLDIGAGEFSPSEEYVKYGWENYVNARGYNGVSEEVVMKSREKEMEKWWIVK
jgi:hypothetical protein